MIKTQSYTRGKHHSLEGQDFTKSNECFRRKNLASSTVTSIPSIRKNTENRNSEIRSKANSRLCKAEMSKSSWKMKKFEGKEKKRYSIKDSFIHNLKVT